MGTSLSRAVSWVVGPESLFKGVTINGGQFIWARTVTNVINQTSPRPGLEILAKHVVPSAMHDSGQRVDPPRCHPNTRDAILEQIFQWLLNSEDREEWILWINGAAGAGKSAIAQTITEKWTTERRAIASFFFSKTDSARDNAAGLVATLAYQLIHQVPQTEDDVLRIIEQDPLIFEKSLESQLKELILDPLVRIHQLLGRLFILVIDGLDECKDKDVQSDLIQGITNLIRGGNLPVIFLIASRLEVDIVASFKELEKTAPLVQLPLDDIPLSQVYDSIRKYLNDKFSDIKRIHPLRDRLPENWPLSSVIERIIAKGSGQFIYASLVVKFVSSPRYHPFTQLEIIDGLRPPNLAKYPFAHLDALYRVIFSQIEPDKLDAVSNIIAYTLLTGENHINVIDWAFQFAPGEVEVLLSDLAAVITCTSTKEDTWPHIRFLHASLSDFLLDRNRSGEYHISAEKYTTELAGTVLSRQPAPRAYHSIIRLLKTVKPSAEIRRALIHYDPNFKELPRSHMGRGQLTIFGVLAEAEKTLFSFLIAVKNLDFDDQTVYHLFLDLVMTYFENQLRIEGTKRYIYLNQLGKQQLENDDELRDLANRLNEAGIIIRQRPKSIMGG